MLRAGDSTVECVLWLLARAGIAGNGGLSTCFSLRFLACEDSQSHAPANSGKGERSPTRALGTLAVDTTSQKRTYLVLHFAFVFESQHIIVPRVLTTDVPTIDPLDPTV